MEHFAELFLTYGYPMLFLLGIVEFLGMPIAAAPVLMVVGAASMAGVLNPVLAVGSVVMGALLTESFWFGLARWRGGRLLDVACGLASNPSVRLHRGMHARHDPAFRSSGRARLPQQVSPCHLAPLSR
jgi:membrane protein DedA with SNARE-associated domain